jgi:hypothetical protein
VLKHQRFECAGHVDVAGVDVSDHRVEPDGVETGGLRLRPPALIELLVGAPTPQRQRHPKSLAPFTGLAASVVLSSGDPRRP